MSKDQLLKELRDLPEEERWDLLGEALEIESSHNAVDRSETPEFLAELHRRIAHYKAHPDDVVSLDEALGQIDRALKDE